MKQSKKYTRNSYQIDPLLLSIFGFSNFENSNCYKKFPTNIGETRFTLEEGNREEAKEPWEGQTKNGGRVIAKVGWKKVVGEDK